MIKEGSPIKYISDESPSRLGMYKNKNFNIDKNMKYIKHITVRITVEDIQVVRWICYFK